MFVVNPSPDEMKAAGLVANQAELSAVLLTKLTTSGPSPELRSSEESIHADVSFELDGWATPGPGKLEVCTSLRLQLCAEKETHDKPGDSPKLVIEVGFKSEYRIPDSPIPKDIEEKCLPAFARLNGLFNCWPYFRQELQHVTGAMGLPGFLLPPLVIRAIKQNMPDPGSNAKKRPGSASRARPPRARRAD